MQHFESVVAMEPFVKGVECLEVRLVLTVFHVRVHLLILLHLLIIYTFFNRWFQYIYK